MEKQNMKDMIKKYQETKDIILRNEIVNDYMDLITSTAYAFAKSKNIDMGELLSYAYEGFVHALDHFEDKNTSFEDYAHHCMKGIILREMPFLMGYENSYFYYNYQRCKKLVLEKEGISDQNIEGDLIILKKVYDYMKEDNIYKRLKFIDFVSRITKASPDDLEEINEVESEYSLDNEIDNIALRESLNEILDTLSEQERIVIIERFGLNGTSPKTLEEIAEKTGKSRERIRQIEKKVLYRIKLGGYGLDDFSYKAK